MYHSTTTLRLGHKIFDLSNPLVMGIINVTPNSFYEHSRTQTEHKIALRTEQILHEGGAIIDLGGYSSRPGAEAVSQEEEWTRLNAALRIVRKEAPQTPLSVDTFRAEIARRCYEEFGVEMINDITGGEGDCEMYATVGRLRLAYVVMHSAGDISATALTINYTEVVADVKRWLSQKLIQLRNHGVEDVVIDPGFGFSKSLEQNYELMKRLDEVALEKCPLLVGISRKSMIYKIFDSSPADALNGTTALHTFALLRGAQILRVHDVREAAEVVRIVSLLS